MPKTRNNLDKYAELRVCISCCWHWSINLLLHAWKTLTKHRKLWRKRDGAGPRAGAGTCCSLVRTEPTPSNRSCVKLRIFHPRAVFFKEMFEFIWLRQSCHDIQSTWLMCWNNSRIHQGVTSVNKLHCFGSGGVLVPKNWGLSSSYYYYYSFLTEWFKLLWFVCVCKIKHKRRHDDRRIWCFFSYCQEEFKKRLLKEKRLWSHKSIIFANIFPSCQLKAFLKTWAEIIGFFSSFATFGCFWFIFFILWECVFFNDVIK